MDNKGAQERPPSHFSRSWSDGHRLRPVRTASAKTVGQSHGSPGRTLSVPRPRPRSRNDGSILSFVPESARRHLLSTAKVRTLAIALVAHLPRAAISPEEA